MKKEDVSSLGIYVALSYAAMAFASIDKSFCEEVMHWGVIARSLVKDFPAVAVIALGVIVYTLETLKGRTDEKSRSWYFLARSSLEGLKTWESHGHEDTIRMVDRELTHFPPITPT